VKKILIDGIVAAFAAIVARQIRHRVVQACGPCMATAPRPCAPRDRPDDVTRGSAPASRPSACCS
jgi:hypothetical protein